MEPAAGGLRRVKTRARGRTRGAGGRVHRRETSDLGAVVGGPCSVERDPGAARHERLTKPFDDERDRRQPKGEADVATKASRGDEREPSYPRAVREKQH